MTLNRRPTPVGEILTEEFLVPLELTQTDLAKAMGVQVRLVNELCRGRRAVTADTALRASSATAVTRSSAAPRTTVCVELRE